MKELIVELEKLDSILKFIGKQEGLYIKESDLNKSDAFNEFRIKFLETDGMIFKTSTPICYILSQKGIVFIANGGYKGERKRNNWDRKSNLIYLIATPIIALVSIFLSITALSRSGSNAENQTYINRSVLLNSIDSCWIEKDTSIKEMKIIEHYRFTKSDSIDLKELIKSQTIMHSQ